MIRIDILSAVPNLMESPLKTSIVKRGQDKGLTEIYVHDLRDYAFDKHKLIDDKPFGGGAGMLLKPEPIFNCISELQSQREYQHIIFTTPRGKILEQSDANTFSLAKNIIILAGHYKGVDERIIEEFVTDEISIGKFVLSGGELPALVLVDSIVRIIPGVLNDSESALLDSFMDGDRIEPPFYTRPANFNGKKVPEILLSGHTKKINEWKEEQSQLLTKKWKKINRLE